MPDGRVFALVRIQGFFAKHSEHVSTRALHSVPLGESEMPRHEISQARAALRPLLSFKLQTRSLRLHSPQARAALRLLLSFKLKSKINAPN
jgi:hypothetical protein